MPEIKPAEVPRLASHWPRAVAIEVSRTQFVALWMAQDKANDVVYLYEEHVVPLTAMPVHADAVRKRGVWIPAIFDPEARGRQREDGLAIAHRLDELGVEIYTVPLNEDAGMLAIAERLTTGRLRAADTLMHWTREYQGWRRDEKGELPEEGGLLLRATALVIQSGLQAAITENQSKSDAEGYDMTDSTRSSTTGY